MLPFAAGAAILCLLIVTQNSVAVLNEFAEFTMQFTSKAMKFGTRALAHAADLSGLNRLARSLNRASVIVLSYHGVIPDSLAKHPFRLTNMVTVSEFRQQISDLLRVYTPLTMHDFTRWLRREKVVSEPAVVVTFDDGYLNNLTYAAPILAEMHCPATLFVTTGYIGQERILWPTEIFIRAYCCADQLIPTPNGELAAIPETQVARMAFAIRLEELCKSLTVEARSSYLNLLRTLDSQGRDRAMEAIRDIRSEMFDFLNWDQVRQMMDLGFEIGSHTLEHPVLSVASGAQITGELTSSKRKIEGETGRECSSFAYPNGRSCDFTMDAVEGLRDAGYEVAFALEGSACTQGTNPLLCDRIWIPGGLGLPGFRTRISTVHQVLKRVLPQRQLLTHPTSLDSHTNIALGRTL